MVCSRRSGGLHIDDDNEGSRSRRRDRRTSNRQADSRKSNVTPSPNSRRSERLENQTTEGQGSHLRRSSRIEMYNPMRSDQKQRPVGKKRNLVKSKVLSEVSDSTIFDLSSHKPTKKRKRLDAKTYKASFSAAVSGLGLETDEEGNAEEKSQAKHCKKKTKKKGFSSGSIKQEPDKEIDKDTCSSQRLDMKEMKNICSEESVSEDGLPTSNNCLEHRTVSLSPRSVKRACKLDSETSLSPMNEHAPTRGVYSAANFPSSSPPSIIECMGKQRLEDCITTNENAESTYPSMNNVEIQKDGCTGECVVCKNPETELCCNGKNCKMCYHLACLDPPMKSVPPGLWFCVLCMEKKVEFGVRAVSEGIDSILDFKEGVQNDNSYLVKYKGLAHVHNFWVSESQLIQEAPELLSKFKDYQKSQKNNITRWKQEWIEPQRLLQKRLLMPQEVANKLFKRLTGRPAFCYEWFVKWKGLGYEDATWELEDSQFLRTPKAAELIHDYEIRHKKSMTSNSFTAKKDVELKKSPFSRLLTLPDGFPADIDNDHLNSINKLREFWHKSQNAILIDDQERVAKALLFLLSLQSHVNQPFLIISPNEYLSLWETEISRLAPSINVVVYSGNKDVRKMIQALEFHDESGCIMFQVLLSHSDVILEDFEVMKFIVWEALIFDDCQNHDVSKILTHFTNLSTDFKLLLMNDQFKDDIVGYINLLSFLCSGKEENFASTLKFDSDNSTTKLALLKERLAYFIAYERKPDSSKFLEYWVPVHLCNVQLERYCATLCSNSSILRSCSKVDHVGALRDTLVSSRKCCDHPYLVDEILQGSLVKDRPLSDHLDVGVNASGKLLVLDKILQALQKHGLRVLILFQSIGGDGRNSIGDILDDYLRQRFGVDCYERVDSGLTMSRRLSALNNFNDKDKGRFVFLIESRACLPSIRLTSIDAVIIYSSDWNPLNDLRALQKIKMESPHAHILLFRLYSTFTVEEKVLAFAKQDLALESNAQNINPSVSHSLLSWGVTYLFHQLDEFHYLDNSNNCSHTSTDTYHLDNVVLDVLSKFPCTAMSDESNANTHLIEALRSGASYSRKIKLVGEKEGISSLDTDPPSFWSNLLDRKDYHWRYVSNEKLQRSRRKIHNSDEPTNLPESKHNEVRGKCRKMTSCSVDSTSLLNCVQDKRKKVASGKIADISYSGPSAPVSLKSASTDLAMESDLSISRENLVSVSNLKPDIINDQITTPMAPEKQKAHSLDCEDKAKLRAVQRNLHHLIKPELSNLCDILELPEDAKNLALTLLEYIMTNHHVSKDSETMLQAIMLSLCWQAASLSKNKVNRDESLARARKFLKFSCSKEMVYTVYDKLKTLKKEFLSLMAPRSEDKHNEVEEGKLRMTTGEFRLSQMIPDKEHIVNAGTSVTPNQRTDDKLLEKRIFNIMAARRAAEFDMKLQKEISDFQTQKGNEKVNLNRAHMKDLELFCTSVTDLMERDDKIKLLKQSFSGKMARFEKHMDCQLRKLKALQLTAQIKEQQIKDQWLEESNIEILLESFHKIPLSDSGFIMEEFRDNFQQETECNHDDNGSLVSPPNCMDRTECLVPRGNILNVVANATDSTFKENDADSAFTNLQAPLVFKKAQDKCRNNSDISCSEPSSHQNIEPGEGAENCDIMHSESAPLRNEVESTYVDASTITGHQHGTSENEGNYIAAGEGDEVAVTLGNAFNVSHKRVDTCPGDIGASRLEVTNNILISDSLHHSSPVLRGVPCPGDVCLSQVEVTNNNNTLILGSLQEPTLVPHEVPFCGHGKENECTYAQCQRGTIIEHQRLEETVGQGNPESRSHVPAPGSANVSQVEATNDNVTVSCSPVHVERSENACAGSQHQHCILEHDRLGETVGPGDLDYNIPMHSSAHISSQVEETNSNVVVPCFPGHSEMPLVGTGQGSEGQSFDPINHSNHQVEVSLNVPAVEPSMVIQRTNLLDPQSTGQATVSNSDTLSQRTFDVESTRTLFHAESACQLFPFAPLLPHQGFQHEPLKNEMIRIQMHGDKLSKMHDDMKVRLEQECEQEIEKIRKKYNDLHKAMDAEYVQKKTILDTIFNKVHMNQILAEEFRAKFICTKAGSLSFSQSQHLSSSQQSLQASQVQLDHRHVLPSPSTPALATTPLVTTQTLPAVGRLRSQSPAVVPIYSGHTPQQRAFVNARNSFGSPFSNTVSSASNFQRASEFRARPPHLQRPRPNMAASLSNLPVHTIGATSQQQYINSGLRGQVASADTYSSTMPAVVVPPVVSRAIPVCQLTAEPAPDVGSNLQNKSQPSDLGTTFGTASPTGGFVQAAADVVCLSDDE